MSHFHSSALPRVRRHCDPAENLLPTPLRLAGASGPPAGGAGMRHALRLEFKLPASSCASMLIRELKGKGASQGSAQPATGGAAVGQ